MPRRRGRRIYHYHFFFSSRRRHTRCSRDWSSDVCSSDLAPGPMWNYARSMPLGPSPAGAAVTVEIECVVDKGSVGFVLWLEGEDWFISREVILEARTGSQRLYLSTTTYEPDTRLLTRSATALGASEYRITSIEAQAAL